MVSHPIVSRFMKGIFKAKIHLCHGTWDVHLVLRYSSSLPEPTQLSLKSLTLKTTMVIARVSAQRGQSLHLLGKEYRKREKRRLSLPFWSTLFQE